MKEFLKLFFLIYFISQIFCECPSYCECEGGDSICTSCLDRHFYGDSCDKPCNESRINCEECEMVGGKCTKCKDNKYKGPNCEDNCNDKCPGGECVPEDGTCYEGDCEDNLSYGNECDIPCSTISEHCEKCHRDGTCISCSDEDYHGIFCNITCPGCPDKKCDDEGICEDKEGNCENDDYYGVNCEKKCIDINSNCLKCNRTRNCYLCKDHFFGTECNDDCSVCPDGLCYNSGECKDPHGNCKDNATYGPDCKDPCTNIDGNCKECSRNRTCILCEDKSFYGDECKTPCYCPDKKCEVDGTCEDSSNDCFNEIFFGTKCNQLCNETRDNCVKCHREGECFACTNETYYGKDCEQKCDNCPEKKCDINGICSEEGDCINMEFYGGFCNDTCISDDRPRCQECHRNNSCTKCNTFNYYGPDCNDYCLLCPENECEIDGKCKIPDKNCYENKTHGDYCNENCTDINENCIKCDREGVCIECLDSLYFGPRCEESCFRCPTKKCKINGDCEESDLPCTDPHFYGNNCSIPCNITNPNCDTCDKDGICLSCFNKEYYGPECETPCEYCPDHLCEIDGNCTDQSNDCFESKYYGVKCNQSCTELNENCLLCNRQEDCFECSNKTYYGDRCNKLCDNCPGRTCNNSGICSDTTSNCEDPTYTGPNCTQKCSAEYNNCEKCDRNNICFECTNETIYGKTCEDTCEQCPDEKEEKGCNIDGICKDDISPCKNKSFTGENCTDFCWEKYDNCLECERDNTCTKCKSNKIYGNNCTDSCEDCPGEEGCYMNGTCVDQINICNDNTKTGEKCDTPCDEIFNNTKRCDRDYLAIECIDQMFYGNYCNDSCANCPGDPGYCYINGTCMNSDDKCDNDTLTGDGCDILCSSIYSNTLRCDRNYNAIECINKTFYGEHCDKSCSNCPGNCTLDGICEDNITDCDDNTLTGQSCNTSCKDIYNNTKKCHRNYIAIECID